MRIVRIVVPVAVEPETIRPQIVLFALADAPRTTRLTTSAAGADVKTVEVLEGRSATSEPGEWANRWRVDPRRANSRRFPPIRE